MKWFLKKFRIFKNWSLIFSEFSLDYFKKCCAFHKLPLFRRLWVIWYDSKRKIRSCSSVNRTSTTWLIIILPATKRPQIVSSTYNPEFLSLKLEWFFRRFYMKFCTKVCICSTKYSLLHRSKTTYLSETLLYNLQDFLFFYVFDPTYFFSFYCFLFHIMLLIREFNKFRFQLRPFHVRVTQLRRSLFKLRIRSIIWNKKQ